MAVYYRQTTFQQRIHLFELVEQLGNVSEACRRARFSHSTYYRWKPQYEKDGVDGLCEPRSHAVHNPHTIDPEIERRIIELRREHPDWGKKRMAQWIWKEDCTRKRPGLPVFKGREDVEDSTMVLEEEADVGSIWLTITKKKKLLKTGVQNIHYENQIQW